MSGLTDREELVELMARYASIADTKDFDELPATVFTDRIVCDFEEAGGGPPFEIGRDELMAGQRAFFAEWQSTHHAITNHRISVDGDISTVRAHVLAQHWLPRDLAPPHRNRWLVVGFYDNEAVRTADGWRLRTVRLSVTYEERPDRF